MTFIRQKYKNSIGLDNNNDLMPTKGGIPLTPYSVLAVYRVGRVHVEYCVEFYYVTSVTTKYDNSAKLYL